MRSVLTTFCPFLAPLRVPTAFPTRHTCWVPLTVYALRELVTACHTVKGTHESEGKGKSHKKYFFWRKSQHRTFCCDYPDIWKQQEWLEEKEKIGISSQFSHLVQSASCSFWTPPSSHPITAAAWFGACGNVFSCCSAAVARHQLFKHHVTCEMSPPGISDNMTKSTKSLFFIFLVFSLAMITDSDGDLGVFPHRWTIPH